MTVAALADFFPLVAQHCPNAPTPSIEFWVRQAAIDFCRRTLAHQAQLVPFDTVADPVTPAYTLPVPAGTQVAKLLACRVDGRPVALSVPSEIDALPDWQAPGQPECAYLTDTAIMTLYPAPATVVPVDVRVALQPTQVAAEVDDSLFEQHAATIAYGAVASLARTPAGRDPDAVRAFGAMYEEGVARAMAETLFNRARSHKRTTPQWL